MLVKLFRAAFDEPDEHESACERIEDAINSWIEGDTVGPTRMHLASDAKGLTVLVEYTQRDPHFDIE